MVSRSTLAVKSSRDACTYRIAGADPLYSPNCRQGYFSETHIQPLGCLCVRTGSKGRFLAREEISTSHLATRLDRYPLEEPTPPASLLQQGSRLPTKRLV